MRVQDLLRASVVTMACTAPSVVAWGAAGHEITATIAQIYLHPSVFPNMCSILNYTSRNPNRPLCDLSFIASWADRNRYRMRWSAPLHYTGGRGDHPGDTCLFPGEEGWDSEVNILNGIRNTTNILSRWKEREEGLNNEALKFLVHFMGDMHMPLHLTGRDRGGNSMNVLFDGRQTNLHSVWDNALIAKSLRTISLNYTQPLRFQGVEFHLRGTIYDPYIRKLIWEGMLGRWRDEVPHWLDCASRALTSETNLQEQETMRTNSQGGEKTDDDLVCPFYWAQPIHSLNCALIWPKELDMPPYRNNTHGFVDLLLSALGGKPHLPMMELDTMDYVGFIEQQWIVEKLLAQAGIRLAGILNWLFADDDARGGGGVDGLWIPGM